LLIIQKFGENECLTSSNRWLIHQSKEADMEKPYDPEKYGLVVCPQCNGSGKLPNNPKGIKVCEKCGGFGLIKKEDAPVKK
jgi:RecJ-like exonuclease